MRADEVAMQLAQKTAKMKTAVIGAGEPVMRRAKTIASVVRVEAARNGHHIAIRVVGRPKGLRVTVVGPQAGRYAKMIGAQIEREMPSIKSEVRAQVKGRSR